nr:immunoglobulin light chain junction region [Macaca mulatta]MOW07572.1 immunoglobulin light chain junction region [Macaca mulatta]
DYYCQVWDSGRDPHDVF